MKCGTEAMDLIVRSRRSRQLSAAGLCLWRLGHLLVHSLVLLEMVRACELGVAPLASIGFLVGVDAHVPYKLVRPGETHWQPSHWHRKGLSPGRGGQERN